MPKHRQLMAPDWTQARHAAAQSDRLTEQVQRAAAALRRDARADCFPLISELQRTTEYLRTASVIKQLYLINLFIYSEGFSDLLGICSRIDAAHDASLCFAYPTEDNPTVLGTVGSFLSHAIITCLHENVNKLCDCGCKQGNAFFFSRMQRALAPALTQLIPQATAALNTTVARLRTLPDPWPSSSPHKLLLGIASLAQVCLMWGGPPGCPKPFSTLATTLAREHIVDAAVRLLTALQDPTLVAHPATPAAFPQLHATAIDLVLLIVSLTPPPAAQAAQSSLDADLTVTPAARAALRTHLLSDHHLLLHLLHTAAVCCGASPNPVTTLALLQASARTPAVHQKFIPQIAGVLKTTCTWLTGSTSAASPLHHQRCYTGSPAAVWRGAAQLLAAIAQPKGWWVAGPEALQLVEALPVRHLAEHYPELVPHIAQPLVKILQSTLQEAQHRRRQLKRHKSDLWELWTGLELEDRRQLAVACIDAAARCLRMLKTLLEGSAGGHTSVGEGREGEAVAGGDPLSRMARSDMVPEGEEQECYVAQLLAVTETRRALRQLLDDLSLRREPRPPLPEDPMVVLKGALRDVNALAASLSEEEPDDDCANAFQEYLSSTIALVAYLAFATLLMPGAAITRDWGHWQRRVEHHLIELRRILRPLSRIFSHSVAYPLVLLGACPGSGDAGGSF